MYEVTVTVGYEYHDNYVETGTRTIRVGGGEVYNMGTAEQTVIRMLLAHPSDDAYEPWVRVEKIERLPR